MSAACAGATKRVSERVLALVIWSASDNTWPRVQRTWLTGFMHRASPAGARLRRSKAAERRARPNTQPARPRVRPPGCGLYVPQLCGQFLKEKKGCGRPGSTARRRKRARCAVEARAMCCFASRLPSDRIAPQAQPLHHTLHHYIITVCVGRSIGEAQVQYVPCRTRSDRTPDLL